MKRFFTLLSIALFVPALLFSQSDNEPIVIERYQAPKNFFSIQAGAWFPKDKEKSFTADGVSDLQLNKEIDQSQAIGIDFQFKARIADPFYFDFSLSAWYSTYDYKLSEVAAAPKLVTKADAWVALVPVTPGISFRPFQNNGAFQPYAMVGLGAYVAFSGESHTEFDDELQQKEFELDEQKVAFGWFFGGGLDFFLSERFGVGLSAKYHSVEFKEMILTRQKDFSGLQISLGVTAAVI